MNNSSVIETTDSSAEYSLHLLNLKNILLTPLLVIVILITILGNLLVIISVMIEKSLRTPSNCLIFSLAITDMIVGLIVMPLRSSVVMFGYWPFDFRCDLPFEFNILTSQASVLHLVAIAIDRYIVVSKIQVSHPLLSTRSKARIMIMLTLVWSIPVLFVSLPFLGWHDKEWKSRNKEFKCIGNRLVWYRVLGALITFYIPITIIILFYLLIYQIASESTRHNREHNVQQIQLNGRQSQVEWDSPTDYSVGTHQTACGQMMCVQNLSILKKFTQNKKEEREKKVAKTLTIITSVFLLCWSPFFIIFTICIKNEDYPHLVTETAIWFGLCNSTVNPIIYAYFVPTFRSAFKKIIRFRKS